MVNRESTGRSGKRQRDGRKSRFEEVKEVLTRCGGVDTTWSVGWVETEGVEGPSTRRVPIGPGVSVV